MFLRVDAHSSMAQEKSPVQSHVRAWWRSLLLRLRNQGVFVGILERRWNLDGRTSAEAATAGNASGSAAQ